MMASRPRPESDPVRYLRPVSFAITALGLLLLAVGAAADVSPTVPLVGMMLIVAGAIKVVTVAIWRGAFGLGMPLGDHEETRDAAIEEGRR
jgi:hypothetical protein